MKSLPEKKLFENQVVEIIPTILEHSKDLYTAGKTDGEEIFNHMFFGPFYKLSDVEDYINNMINRENTQMYSVFSKRLNKIVGALTISNIKPQFGVAELGNIWYSTEAQGSEINTNTIFLLLQYLFEENNYRRIEWKCDASNLSSVNSAKKLGFEFDGLFKRHMIIRNRNRDTAWFSIIDLNWKKQKIKLEERIKEKNKIAKELGCRGGFSLSPPHRPSIGSARGDSF